jgi:hypothetical protein
MPEKKDTISVAVSSSTAAGTIAAFSGTGYGVGLGYASGQDQLIIAPDDHPIYAKVGKVASDWAHVEHTLDMIIWELSGIEFQKGAAITAQLMGAFSRFKAILALLAQPALANRKNLGTVVTRTTDLMNKSSGPGDKRNRIVHDPWYAYTASGKTAQFRAMPHKDHRYGIQLVDSDVLEDALRSIKEFSGRVENLKKEISSLASGS